MSTLRRALNRFGINRTDPEAAQVIEEQRVHTAVHDEQKPDEITALGELTGNEARLLRQGGVAAVKDDRRWNDKEHRLKCRDRECQHRAHGDGGHIERKIDVSHTNETTGKPCTFCLIPSTDPERAYYNCVGVGKAERLRRDAARDYATNRGKVYATTKQRMVSADDSNSGAPMGGQADQQTGQEARDPQQAPEGTDATVSTVRIQTEQGRAQGVTQEVEARERTTVKRKAGRPKGARDIVKRTRTVRWRAKR